MARKPAICGRLGPEDGEGPCRHQRCHILVAEGNVHEVTDYLRPTRNHCDTVRRDMVSISQSRRYHSLKINYNHTRRKHRRLAAGFLSTKAVASYVPGLKLEVIEMVKQLYIRGGAGALPINPQPHAGRTSLNNILTIAFGTRTETIDHPLVAHWLKHSREFMYVCDIPGRPIK